MKAILNELRMIVAIHLINAASRMMPGASLLSVSVRGHLTDAIKAME